MFLQNIVKCRETQLQAGFVFPCDLYFIGAERGVYLRDINGE